MPKTILTVTSLKGGVGKSTSAIHLAQYFCRRGPTLLVDGDPNRSVLEWSQRGVSLPFTVITDRQLAREAGQYDIIIIDTKGRPEEDDLREMIEYSDLVIVPCFAEAQALGTLRHLREKFQKLNSAKYRILLTNIPPLPQQDGPQCRAFLLDLEMPLFDTAVRSLKAFKRASFAGTTVDLLRDDPRACLGWSDYVAIGEQIEAILGLPELNTGSTASSEPETPPQQEAYV
jgi:chromosome partitioning protein